MFVKSEYESCLPSSCCRGREEATPRDAHVTGSTSCCRGRRVAESRDVHHVTGSMDGSTSENIQVSVATSGARSCCTIERLMKMADRRLFLKEKCRSSKCHWCRSVCAQTVLVLVNFFFLVIGWTIAAFGMWLHLSQDSLFYAHLLRDNPSNSFVTFDRLAILLIWSGGFLAAISFLGCCGACAESICFLGFFCLLLLLVIIAEVLLVSWSTVFQNKLVQQMSQGMIYQLQNEYNKTALRNNGSSLEILQLTVAWNTLQTKFNCCGVIGPQDYLRSVWFNSSQDTDGIFVPESCCVSVVVSDDSTYTTDNYCQIDAILFPKDRNYSHYLKTQGCHRVVTDWLLSYSDQSSTTLIITATIQVVVLVLACELIRWVQKQQSDHRWQNDDSCYE